MLLCTSAPGGAGGFCLWFWESFRLPLCNALVWRSKDFVFVALAIIRCFSIVTFSVPEPR